MECSGWKPDSLSVYNFGNLFADGSGYAQFSYDSLLFANLGKALVAAGGPLGPTIAGSIFLISSINLRATRIILFIFALLLLTSCLIWVRPFISFGFAISAIFAFVFGWISLYGKDGLKIFTLRFIGIQAFASVYQSIGYLYSSGGVVDGRQFSSDTQIIAENILLPVWFSATLILIVSILSIFYSIKFILRKNL